MNWSELVFWTGDQVYQSTEFDYKGCERMWL